MAGVRCEVGDDRQCSFTRRSTFNMEHRWRLTDSSSNFNTEKFQSTEKVQVFVEYSEMFLRKGSSGEYFHFVLHTERRSLS